MLLGRSRCCRRVQWEYPAWSEWVGKTSAGGVLQVNNKLLACTRHVLYVIICVIIYAQVLCGLFHFILTRTPSNRLFCSSWACVLLGRTTLRPRGLQPASLLRPLVSQAAWTGLLSAYRPKTSRHKRSSHAPQLVEAGGRGGCSPSLGCLSPWEGGAGGGRGQRWEADPRPAHGPHGG